LFIKSKSNSCANHTTPEEFKNGGFTLKTHQMFPVHTTPPDEFDNVTITGHFGFEFEKTPTGKSHDIVRSSFSKVPFSICFCPHENEKPAFSNSSGLKSGFKKFRFHDGYA